MNQAYHCFHYYSHHRDYAAYRDLIRPVFIFFWDKASYYWGISQCNG